MTHQDSSHVISLPVEHVEAVLRDVARWPHFVVGVKSVEQTAFERYVFRIQDGIQDGGKARDVPVAVVAHPSEHRITWHALSGPAFEGEFRLTSAEGNRTRVHLSMVAEPAGFLSGLSELLGFHGTSTELTIQRLDTEVTDSGETAGSGSGTGS